MKCEEAAFYAAYKTVPPANTSYDRTKNQFIIEFQNTDIRDKLDPSKINGRNRYINSVSIKRNGSNTAITVSLKDTAKYYTIDLSHLEPAVDDFHILILQMSIRLSKYNKFIILFGVDVMNKNIDFGFVADIYDDYVNVDFDIPFYKLICKKYSGNILELMCGTGRISLPLIEDGVNLTCVDYSQEMLDMLAKKIINKNNSLICQDICDLEINKKFNFIFIPFNSITEIIDKEKRKQAIRRVYEHLIDNGDFLVTLYNPVYRLESVDGNLKCMGKFDISYNRTLIVTYYNSYNQSANLIYGTQFYEIYDEKNRLTDKRFLNISFSLVSKDEIIEMCGELGFKLKELYGDYNFGEFNENSRFMNFLFTKQTGS